MTSANEHVLEGDEKVWACGFERVWCTVELTDGTEELDLLSLNRVDWKNKKASWHPIKDMWIV